MSSEAPPAAVPTEEGTDAVTEENEAVAALTAVATATLPTTAATVEMTPVTSGVMPLPPVEETQNLTHLQRFYKILYGGTTEDTIQWAKSSRHVSQEDWNKRVHILRHWDTGYNGMDRQTFRAQHRAGYNWSRDFYVGNVDGKDRLLTKANDRLCIPIGEVFAAIAQYHDKSHKGEHKTYAEVSEKYCNISREQIKAYIQTCDICRSSRNRRTCIKKEDVPVPASVTAAYIDLNVAHDNDPESQASLQQHRENFERQALRQFEASKTKSTNKQLSPTEMKERIYVMTHWDTGADGISVQNFRRQNMAGYVWMTKFRIHGDCLALRETGKLYIATDQIFDAIHKSHYGQRHAGLHTTYAQLCTTYGNITRQLVSIFIKTCPFCVDRKRGSLSTLPSPPTKRARPLTDLPETHPIRAYLGDAQALVTCLVQQPDLLHCKELTFLREIVDEERLVSKSRSSSMQHHPVILSNTSVNRMTEGEDVEVAEGSQEEKEEAFFYDVLIVGAGPAGIGVAAALLRGGLDPSRLLILERGLSVGTSFREWHENTRFISPSWPTFPFGSQDLNVIVPDTAVYESEHPTGDEYASYLERQVTENMSIKFNHEVIKIEKPTLHARFEVHANNKIFRTAHVIWCGGEWAFPKFSKGFFDEDCIVHYKDFDETGFVKGEEGDNVVVVGMGEAGVEVASTLVTKGASVILVEQQKKELTSPDPSRQLSASARNKLQLFQDQLKVMRGFRCVSAFQEDGIITFTLNDMESGDCISMQTKTKIIFCTGFDVSVNPVIKDWFVWKNGYPVVSPANDESTKTPNLFVCGPMLRHQAPPPANSTSTDQAPEVIVFCFIYKFRTRFPLVAGDILSRVVHYRHCTRAKDSSIIIDMEGHEILSKLESMQAHYKSKSMLLSDLTCASQHC